MQSFDLYCFDLDGTLLDSRKRISGKALAEIRALHEDGKHIILASGRHYRDIMGYAEELGLKEGDFAISCDGQYIHDHSGSVLFRFQMLRKDDAITIDRCFRDNVKFISSDNSDYTVVPSTRNRITLRLKNFLSGNRSCRIVGNAGRLPDDMEIEKIRVAGNDGDIDDIISRTYSVHADDIQIDIQHKDVNKFNALKKMLDEGLIGRLESLLYFGNDVNDLECFDNLKWTVAMGDSAPFLLMKAAFTTDTCDNDGVAGYLERIRKDI